MLKERVMDDPHSVNSPRRVLSLSRKRKETLVFPEHDDQASGFGVSGEHGPKPSEVYGFVGSISTVVATEHHHRRLAVEKNRRSEATIDGRCSSSLLPLPYWALAVPTYAMVTVILAIGFYIGLNFMATPPPTSLNTMFDEYSREPLRSEPSVKGNEQPIKPLSDIGINQINDLMFNV
ncbi:hypothetical protein TEA_017831 [Camellia sinensis var. sinensis]|uniref:PIG-P domain-containing protein n=1 Tax=Camellia sinensis var. sinensis TaxID=542762 RepID=A0A4S4D8H1_CAMSN|nr:hypothetical protein TEA_017831 [Camellia sinensis var. sinensis]